MTRDEAKEWAKREVPTDVLIDDIFDHFEQQEKRCKNCRLFRRYETSDDEGICLEHDIEKMHENDYCSKWQGVK